MVARRKKPQSIEIGSPDESFREGLFTRTNEDKPASLWPVSPISSFTLDISVNTSIRSFISNIPKTVFTPSTIQADLARPKRQ
jgi:hypothetical protein